MHIESLSLPDIMESAKNLETNYKQSHSSRDHQNDGSYEDHNGRAE